MVPRHGVTLKMIDYRPRLTREPHPGPPNRVSWEMPPQVSQWGAVGDNHSDGKSCPRALAVDLASVPGADPHVHLNQGLARAGSWSRPHGLWVFRKEVSGFGSGGHRFKSQLSCLLGVCLWAKDPLPYLQWRAIEAGPLWS